MINILIAGFGGGLVRNLVGFTKHQYSYKDVKFDVSYFLTMGFISGVIGVMTAMATKELGLTFFGPYFTPAVAFFVGYTGGDFVENVVKIIMKKPSLYNLPKDD